MTTPKKPKPPISSAPEETAPIVKELLTLKCACCGNDKTPPHPCAVCGN